MSINCNSLCIPYAGPTDGIVASVLIPSSAYASCSPSIDTPLPLPVSIVTTRHATHRPCFPPSSRLDS